VRACAEIQGRFVWGVGGRGDEARIVAGVETGLLEARCDCGPCGCLCGLLPDRRVRKPHVIRSWHCG
jgi:predicted molibdopterin-dependent oxidoreductase YjgC